MRTDGRTDMTKLLVAFRNFANAPTNVHNASQTPTNSIITCHKSRRVYVLKTTTAVIIVTADLQVIFN